MIGNEDLGYRRPISHQNLISKHVLDKFWENRKKIHFFHLPPVGLGQNNVEIDIFRPNIGHIILRPGPNTLGLFPKKNVTVH